LRSCSVRPRFRLASANRLREKLTRALDLTERVATTSALEADARTAASSFYHAAVLMCWEAGRPGVDARRALLARLILEHRLSLHDPIVPAAQDWEREAAGLIFAKRKLSLAEVGALLRG